MTKKIAPEYSHTPLFTRGGKTGTRGRPAGYRLTEAGRAIVAFLRTQSSTTIRDLAAELDMPQATLRGVLTKGEGMSQARMEHLLRLVSPKLKTESFQKIPDQLLHEFVQGAGVIDVTTEVKQKALLSGRDNKAVPVHVGFDQLSVVANFLNPKTMVLDLRDWLRAWMVGGEQATPYILEHAARRGEPLLLVRRSALSEKDVAYVDLPYHEVYEVFAYDKATHPHEPRIACIGIGRMALCRRHRWRLKDARTFIVSSYCPGCRVKSQSRPQLFLRIEGRGFASGKSLDVARAFFLPFARPGKIWVSGYDLALDALLPFTDVVTTPTTGGTRRFAKVTLYPDSGVETEDPVKTQPNEGMVTGIYFGATPSPVVVYDKSERLALGHGARPRWLVHEDAVWKAQGHHGNADLKFTRVELRVRPKDGCPEGLLEKGAPPLLEKLVIAERGALFADGLRGALLDALSFEGLLGHDEVTRLRFSGRPRPVVMKPFWKALQHGIAQRLKAGAPTSTRTAKDAEVVTQVAKAIVEATAAADGLDLQGALTAALPGLQAELLALTGHVPGKADE